MATVAPTQAQQKQRRRQRRQHNKSVRMAMTSALVEATKTEPARVDPAEALQVALDRGVAMLTYAMERVDKLDVDDLFIATPFGPVPDPWLSIEKQLREEVHKHAARMVEIGIADRAVRLEEAKAQILVRAVMEAAREAGISRDKVRELGPAIRRHLTLVEPAA